MVAFPIRYIVSDNGAQSTVTDSLTGRIVFTGPYERAVSQAAELNRQASEYYNPTTTVVSSGDLAVENQKAKAPDSGVQSPPQDPLILDNGRIKIQPSNTNGSTADVGKLNVDYGLDGDIRKYLTTQSTPPGANQTSTGPTPYQLTPPGGVGLKAPTSVGGQPGVGASGDDAGKVNPTLAEINAIDYGDKIIPQANVLDQYATYNYQASLYLMNEVQYQTMINTKQKNINGAQLLVQSGGASAGTGRNEFFSLDYYIDSIELNSKIVGKGVGLAHNVTDIRMTVIEPNGITFLKNLDSAVQQFIGSGTQTYYDNNGTTAAGTTPKKYNFTSQIYLLVIKFYGYDDQGNLIRGGVNKPNQTSDPNAFVEKWYPFVLSNVKFKVANKAVEYQIEATAVPYYINASAARGTIPYNIELSGQTLKDLLAGPIVYSSGQDAVTAGSPAARTTVNIKQQNAAAAANGPRGRGASGQPGAPVNIKQQNAAAAALGARGRGAAIAAQTVASAPPKADAANTAKKTVRSGLMAALNEYQQDLKKQKIIEVPDEYEIEFAIDALASAKVINPGLNIGATSMSKPGTAADQKLGSKQSMDPNSRVSGATAGMQIVQFIDNLVRTSSYIKDQQLITINEDTGKETASGVNVKNTSWYKISFEATPINWDNKRNDYAYRIKYIISPYKISQLYSPYFKPPLYNGSHKQYTYWFSGQNDSVLSYEENLNALYYQILSGQSLDGATSNAYDLLKFQYQTRSGQTDMGAEGKVNEPGANAADQLYSPSDLKECHMTIVGDPAWLQQGEAWAGFVKGDTSRFQPFLADGTINFDSQQILFEIGYNVPADYNINTGLIQPANDRINSVSQQDQILRRQGPTQTNRLYIATDVKSHFARGKFTQDIKGSLMLYYPNESSKQQQTEQPSKSSQVAAPVQTVAPPFAKTLNSSVTNPTPSSSTAKGQEALLRPTFNGSLTDNQLLSTPAYQEARRSGKSGSEALAIARAASQNGTNDYRGSILPGVVDTSNNQYIVKDR